MTFLQPAIPFGPIVILGLVAFLIHHLYRLAHDPLRRVPGPWLARFTRLWELHQIRRGHFEQINVELHQRYGPIVRIAPNRYSISSPAALQTIYGHGSKFTKDRWYRAYGHPDDSQADMFSVMDERRHAAHRRKVASMFSMTSMVAYEPFVNSCNTTLVEQLSQRAARGESVAIPRWMQYYAFDVIGEITVGASFGMMRTGGDIDGILQTLQDNLSYSSRMSLFVELHSWIGQLNHLLGSRSSFENINAFVHRHLAARRHARSDRPDFIQKLIDLQEAGKVNDLELFNTINANIAAGSDTTGLTLSAAIYHLARNKSCAERLREEIDARLAAGQLSTPISFSEAQQMPYLQAIIKEVLRVHPAVGLPLPRVVPAPGVELERYFFPKGTVVGMNAWVVHRDQDVFGADADIFRPERWLGPKEEVVVMDKTLFSFGAGSRTCVGKNISLLEITKLIPELYRRFDFQLEGDEWRTDNVFFVKPSFTCRVVSRAEVD
ncbi:hypothetical protein N7537_006184 [Penicillium hordei]|uniref:Pisatin demethylase n=1 Tax=Penicillium hordei TaxID=40994 RepID=A0AAD6E7G5_9EURO|nr:uncharacterized protein N7537_006184 [Penicillium hordei]KAJ5603228.1 hypothetical protein N7537_006184 [Penicillium hordei]